MSTEQALTPPNGADPDSIAAQTLVSSSDDADSNNEYERQVEKAKKQGWKDKTEYVGPEDEWVDAPIFNERAFQINPILRAKNQRLESALADRDRRLSALEQTVDGFKKQTVSDVRKSLEINLQTLRTQKAEAIREGDGDKVNDIDDQMYEVRTKLDGAKREGTGANDTTIEPPAVLKKAAQNFAESFSWYGKDRYKTGIAHLTAADVREDRPDLLDTPEFFDEVAKRVRVRLNERDTRGNLVEGGGNSGSRTSASGTKSYNHLPADVKEVCDRQVEQKLFKDRVEFCKYYFEQEGV